MSPSGCVVVVDIKHRQEGLGRKSSELRLKSMIRLIQGASCQYRFFEKVQES
jgi:hypothetical protein